MSGFGRQVPNAAEIDPLNVRVNASINGTLDELPDKFEFWNKDEVREAAEGFMRADEYNSRTVPERVKNAEAWMAFHPEYINDPKGNNLLMNHELVRMFGETEWTIDQYDAAYRSLRSSNFLRLDAKEVEKQRKAEATQRAEAHKARTFSEAELYAMPMEELEARGRGWK